MKLNIKPIYLHSRIIPFEGFKAITILFFVIIRKEKNLHGDWVKQTLTPIEERHETWHVWQQLCLFVLGIVCAAITHFALWLADVPNAAWAWVLPIALPLGLYVVCWLAELLLPPYATAYKDICFESEALFHEYDENPRYIPFSFVFFIPNKKYPNTYWCIGEEYFNSGGRYSKEELREKHRFLRILGY